MYETKSNVYSRIVQSLNYYKIELEYFERNRPEQTDRIAGIKNQVNFYTHIYEAFSAIFTGEEDGVLLRIHFKQGPVLEKTLTKRSSGSLHRHWLQGLNSLLTLTTIDGEQITINVSDILYISGYQKETITCQRDQLSSSKV